MRGFQHSISYVAINTVISITVALPAAYAFSRYRFIGDKHVFFWLLSNLMAPPAVFALPFFNLYSSIGLFDTVWAVALAHCLAAAGVLTMIPGAIVIWFVRNNIAKGFALGRV